MLALLKKDLRIYRGGIVTAIVVVCLPYVMGTMLAICNVAYGSRSDVTDIYGDVAGVGMAGAMLVAAIFGGCAFAVEGRDRWGEFLAMMPVKRHWIVVSKILIAFGALFVVWIIHASIDYVMLGDSGARYMTVGNRVVELARPRLWGSFDDPGLQMFYSCYVAPAAGIVLTFGTAWLASIFLRSPAIAACVGLAVLMCFFLRTQLDEIYPTMYVLVAAAFAVGCFCFFLGTILFLDRVGF